MTNLTVVHTKSATEYAIQCLALDTTNATAVVVYRNEATGESFTRPIEEFFGTDSDRNADGKRPFRFAGAITKINQLLDAARGGQASE